MKRKQMMTPEHEEHLQSIKDKVCELIDVKYRKGVAEHGGKLWEKPLDFFEKEIENEMADLLVYWVTFREINYLKKLVSEAGNGDTVSWESIKSKLNL